MQTVIQAMEQASALQGRGDIQEAEQVYNQILSSAPEYHPAYHAWGLLAFESLRAPLAASLIAQAVLLAPHEVLYQRNLGEIYRRLGRLSLAIECGEAAAKLAPKDIDCHYNLGLALADSELFIRAVESYRRAVELNSQHGLSWNNLGSALEQVGLIEEALEAYRRAVEINPNHSEAQNNLGALMIERGELGFAQSCLESAVAANPLFLEAHQNLSSLKTYTLDDPHLIQLKQLADQFDGFSIAGKVQLAFAYAKALEDTQQYDIAFHWYQVGNQLEHQLYPVDEVAAQAEFEELRDHFSQRYFGQRLSLAKPVLGDTRTPVFIIGMPRSGTTLIEQVLSTHPQLFGAGELINLSEIIEANKDKAIALGRWSQRLTQQQVEKLGRDYLDEVWKLAPEAKYISDKMPANFHLIGLIVQMFPNAKIIHARRDPMDSCFSCFSKHFKQTMAFSYDLTSLGNYYSRYIELMNHWHKVLPVDTILDVQYEAMVAEFPVQAKRITDYVGLPWNDAVLEFHKNKRSVKTASHAQVRKPIYSTSVARWENFSRHLEPLLEIVKDYR